MNLQKRIAQCTALMLALLVLVNAAATVEVPETVVKTAQPTFSRTAGVFSASAEIEAEASNIVETAQIAEAEVAVVAATNDQVDTSDAEYDEWQDRVMANVNDYLYIRSDDTSDSEIIGKLRAGDVATLVDVYDGWYEIESGNAHGFVSADFCVTGIEAYDLALDVCKTYATTTTGGLRLRSEASEDSKIIKTIPVGTKLIVDPDAEEVDGWVAVSAAGSKGYVKAEYVDVDMQTGEAITIEEEQAAKAAAEEAAAKAKAAAAQTQANNQAIIASADDLVLLASIIQIEAGWEPYEGQVGVGAVVLNRVRSGAYPNSVGGVIFAKGQFATGRMSSVIAKGPRAVCLQAAADALAGADTTGGATHFRRAGSKPGLIIGHHVFY